MFYSNHIPRSLSTRFTTNLKFKFGLEDEEKENRKEKEKKERNCTWALSTHFGPFPVYQLRSPPPSRGADGWARLVGDAASSPSQVAALWGQYVSAVFPKISQAMGGFS
jgi:hypothetical protein